MSLSERIEKEYVDAYKAKDSVRISVLRLLKTAIKNQLVELRRPQGNLSDSEILDVIIKQAKQRQDSIAQYTEAKREDLAAKEAGELEILKQYLPRLLSQEELARAVEDAIRETGASGPRDMGRVMSLIMARHKGQADGKEVSAAVKKRLGQC